ncbi:MAG: hypothetical protein KatS3mg057_2634 [Herpetosiphonaceae bacterium]|nr:MAG: hypothetical protein KatS3mg057_2634 [Herpetosiphonaceae bacterium]
MSSEVSRPSLSDRVASAVFWNTALFPVKFALKFLAALVVAWALTTDEYGRLQGSAGSVVASLWVYAGLGISATLLKFVPEIRERQGRSGVLAFLRAALGIRLLLLLLVALLLNLFTAFFVDLFELDEIGPLLIRAASALILLRAVTDTAQRVLVAGFRQKTTNLLDIVSGLVQPTLMILFVAPWLPFDWGIPGAIYALLAGAAIDLLLALYHALRELRSMPIAGLGEAQPVPRLWQRFGQNALMNYVMDLSINITSPDFIALLLLAFARHDDLAYLEFGWNQVMVLLTYLVIPLSGIYVPMFSEIYTKGDKHKLQAAYATLTRALLLLTVPAGIIFIALAPAYFTLLRLAEKFEASIAVAQVLTLFLFAESIVVVPHVILMVYERYRVVLFSRLVALAAVPLLIAIARDGDPLLIALVVGGARFVSRAMLTPYLSWRWRLRFPWAFCMRVVVPSLAAALIVQPVSWLLPVAIDQPVWQNLFAAGLQGLVAAGIFLAGFKALGGLDDEDRSRLATMRLPLRRLIVKYL